MISFYIPPSSANTSKRLANSQVWFLDYVIGDVVSHDLDRLSKGYRF